MWIEKLINVNPVTRPGAKLKGVRKIVNHYTANPGASAHNHYRYFNGTAITQKRYASAHIFVDKQEAYLIIPLDEVAYHANDGSYKGIPELKPNANLYSIGVELCIEKDGSFHPETLRRAAEINAELCKRFKLDPQKDIVRHYDVTHKNCPARWVKYPNEFTEFKNMVSMVLTPPKAKPKKEGVYWDGSLMSKGQIGRLTIIKPINLWKRVSVCSVEDCEYCKNKQPELKFERILNPDEVYRVYGYDGYYGGQYNVGGGFYITDMEGYVKYETPSKAKLNELREYYK